MGETGAATAASSPGRRATLRRPRARLASRRRRAIIAARHSTSDHLSHQTVTRMPPEITALDSHIGALPQLIEPDRSSTFEP